MMIRNRDGDGQYATSLLWLFFLFSRGSDNCTFPGPRLSPVLCMRNPTATSIAMQYPFAVYEHGSSPPEKATICSSASLEYFRHQQRYIVHTRRHDHSTMAAKARGPPVRTCAVTSSLAAGPRVLLPRGMKNQVQPCQIIVFEHQHICIWRDTLPFTAL
ncbi:hypothetical protein IQ06DRAFT_11188 [Phaeosphaeriaceae sp. SRC1lsM3a]|nr:hypothetical protein IQ06DRAFT_11188 [Stagonospora sp. SRC1lsM3a]